MPPRAFGVPFSAILKGLICLLALWLGSFSPANAYSVVLPDSLRQTSAADSLVLAQCPGYTELRVGSVLFVGNSVTKERVLRAELDFREGDTLTAATLSRRLEANRLRLYNLQLFHQVLVQAVCRDGNLTVLFSMQERWYTFPIPIFSLADRNFRSWLDRPDRWNRIDYGVHLVRRNFRGRNEQVLANVQLGFNRKYELFYEAPGYGKRRRIGFGVGVSYYQSHALDYITVRDRLVNFRQEEGFPIERQYVVAGLRWRRTVQHRTALDISHHREQVSDSLYARNPAYFLGRSRREYLEFALISILNQRNTFAYPLTGQYVEAGISYRKFLTPGSPDITTLRGRYARYVALGGDWFYSAGVRGQVRFAQHLAYADSRSFGYETLVRGYDAYVIEGRHYALLQQGLTYRLFDAARVKLNGINNAKINSIPLALYLNTFADVGYVRNPQKLATNQLPNKPLAAIGLGLHLATYYDWVFTLEYSRNVERQGGFFFRTEFPI
ncbi:Surface antigen [Hymenobacter gelipurpurascens]|uniref:Surface antigen n=1 Tax=Hymenobacter gelipurpurascens TaxID=89968 RepID=A0A212UGQ6_9BACT|nr:outer membrane protein assembly factor [Hymenobacter gelipurpurascens]SNC77427.1 Surface antigen [Hymenobacter gelipurpurascens]